MLTKDFEKLPNNARVWVYGADRRIDGDPEKTLLGQVDNYLTDWKAHGLPLTAGRDWRENRFLTIAVDQNQAGASGCSIDGLFRTLKSLEKKVGAGIVTSGLIFYRDKQGEIQAVSRDDFSDAATRGEVDADTEVFDLSVTTLGEWRARFASPAGASWHSVLLPASAHGQ
ncbi:MAG: hypothetical protein ABR582_00235 [Gemmatimonadaceae bacterium]